MIFFNLVQIFATSKMWSESVSAPGSVYTSCTLFLNCTLGLHHYSIISVVYKLLGEKSGLFCIPTIFCV
jgi:hypothetical protein